MSKKGVPASECLQKSCPAPNNVLVKDFARWYCKSRRSRLAPLPNLKSVRNILKKFFAGFERITETEISNETTIILRDIIRKLIENIDALLEPLMRGPQLYRKLDIFVASLKNLCTVLSGAVSDVSGLQV
jgi:hypothetical protein